MLAFTLIEMVVVVGIVIVIVGLVLPSLTALWNERKMAESVNTFQGLFMTARARALRPDGDEVGFFAYVDENGAQHLVPIEPHPCALADPAWQNVFVPTSERDQVLPVPMRVMPRYAAEAPATPTYDFFEDPELANNSFENPTPPFDQAQRHRNFFAIIFSRDGVLVVERDVLIQDKDEDKNGEGDRTELRVGPGDVDPSADPKAYCAVDHPGATTTQYYQRESSSSAPVEIYTTTTGTRKFPWLVVVDGAEVAINFPSIDGLLIYDDSLFQAVAPDQKRAYLLRTAQPLYVSRFTGEMIRGPVGEAQ